MSSSSKTYTRQIAYSQGNINRASKLDSVIFAVGILAVLRSKSLAGKCIGVMITASHNPAADNGVKLVDPKGEMLEQHWEAHATALANAADEQAFVEAVQVVIKQANIKMEVPASIVYAHDTRPSYAELVASLEDGTRCFADVKLNSAGLLTTPQLHHYVRSTNDISYGTASEAGYYEKMARAFIRLCKGKQPLPGKLTVDCANGVGAPKLRALLDLIPSESGLYRVHVLNDDITKPESLNHNCGADYVKTNQRPPPGLSLSPSDPSASASSAFDRYASLDGDADRIVFYYADSHNTFKLLDGDKIAQLAAMYIKDLVKGAGLDEDFSLGVVQTAYANGSSTAYLKKTLQLPVVCTPTGVKYLHHAAEKFDIGIYFEANGHGTILFSNTAVQKLQSHQPQTPAQKDALETLLACIDLINQTVGDALSDMLFVEAILRDKAWTCASWDQSYVDLPNRLSKVIVKDRNLFVTKDAERKLVRPEGLQQRIDDEVAKFKQGRSFVRPSGTEDCVRVYAEAATKGEADGELCCVLLAHFLN